MHGSSNCYDVTSNNTNETIKYMHTSVLDLMSKIIFELLTVGHCHYGNRENPSIWGGGESESERESRKLMKLM